MRAMLAVLTLVLSLLALNTGHVSAAMNSATVTLHPANMHLMSIAHATGSAHITYTNGGHDATIKLTTDNLPRPATLHASAYVLWLVNGSHRVNAGALHINGMMAGLTAMTMDTAFNRLVVTAEKSMSAAHPMGTRVLVGTVMKH